jgi:hypothetical protein
LGGIEGEVGAEDSVTFSAVEEVLLFIFVVAEEAIVKTCERLA